MQIHDAMRHLFRSGELIASNAECTSGSEVVVLLLQTPACQKDHDLYLRSISKVRSHPHASSQSPSSPHNDTPFPSTQVKSRSRGLSIKSRTFVNSEVYKTYHRLLKAYCQRPDNPLSWDDRRASFGKIVGVTIPKGKKVEPMWGLSSTHGCAANDSNSLLLWDRF